MHRAAIVALLATLACSAADPDLPEDVVDEGCKPGSRPAEDGSCFPAGVATCAEGFESDGDYGCRAVLPGAPCAPGQIAVPGDTACRPVAPCPQERYPLVPAS